MNIKTILDEQIERINTKEFIKDDPVQFPHRFDKLQDIEIAAFTTATIAWGKRSMILRDADRMFSLMNNSPYDFVMNKGFEYLGNSNVHRTFFQDDLAYMLRGLYSIYSKYRSINEMVKEIGIGKNSAPAWYLCETMRNISSEANNWSINSQCFPSNYNTSALKRINLAVKWLVRNDGIVDLGVWDCINPSQLYIPLDVHVGNTARKLNILTRKSNDRKAVEELTKVLKEFNAQDPVIYDYALFGIGVNSINIENL
ncbi:MAG: TIGR02757 family protein [Bacteroidales bacterium]|nr:TIGR02757 family protein [Bacteroidales bacterium]MBR5532828.1 TIGR02757 family protein [Bacteroidales bacterium]